MKKCPVIAAGVAIVLSGCTPAQASTDELSARWGETVEVDGISVSLDDNPGHGCYKLSIGNERWFRSISPDEGGAIIGYAGVQDGDVHLYVEGTNPKGHRLNWGTFAPIDAGGTKTETICGQYYAESSRIEVDVANTTVTFN